MIHVLQDRIGIDHVLVTGHPFDVRNEANTAGVLLVFGIVQALSRREMKRSLGELVGFVCHGYLVNRKVLRLPIDR